VAWQARHGTAAVREAARAVWQGITDCYPLDLLVELSGSPAINDDLDSDPLDHEARHAHGLARRVRLVDQLLTEKDPAVLVDRLESLCGLLEDASAQPANPTQLLWQLAKRAPGRGSDLAVVLAQAPDRPLTPALRPLLAALLTVAPTSAAKIASVALDDASVVKARAVASAWAWPPWEWSEPEVRGVFERVMSHDDPVTRAEAADTLRVLAHDDPAAATAAALEARIEALVVAEEVAALLVNELHDRGHPLRDPTAVDRLLSKLAPLPDLSAYWVEELLRRLAQKHLLAVARFLLDRIRLASNQTADAGHVQAVPFEWRAAPDGQRAAELPGAAEALRLVRDAALEPDGAHAWWTPRLFAALADGYDDLALDVLAEFITVGDEEHVLAAAYLLTEAPHRFVLDRAPFVVKLLAVAHGISAECLSRVEGALWGSAFGGVRRRTPGEPDREDAILRDRARELAATLRPGPARAFYRRLAEAAEQEIADDLRRDDERLP
jgi:hypothetical protein